LVNKFRLDNPFLNYYLSNDPNNTLSTKFFKILLDSGIFWALSRTSWRLSSSLMIMERQRVWQHDFASLKLLPPPVGTTMKSLSKKWGVLFWDYRKTGYNISEFSWNLASEEPAYSAEHRYRRGINASKPF